MRNPSGSPRRRASLVGAAIGIVAIALAGCTAGPAEEEGESEITIRVPALPNEGNWNPDLGGGAFDLAGQAVFDPLFRWESALEIRPWLAREYEISEDGLTLKAQLVEGVEYTDGTPLTAESVAEYFNRYLAAHPISYLDGTVFTATGEYELTITTPKPMHDLWLRGMSHFPIMHPGFLDDPEAFRDEPVGTGPYTLEDSVPGSSMTFVRNPDYWNSELFDFDRVTLVILEDDVAALNALKSGQIDATDLRSALAVEAEAEGFNISRAPGVGWMDALMLRDRAGEIQPALADVRVRQAISFAFDRESIAETLYSGYASTSSQPFPRDNLHYVEGGDDDYAFDPDRAKELLEEAGYEDGFELSVVAPADTAAVQPAVEQALADIGITVEWVAVPDYITAAQNTETAAALINLALIGTVDHLEFFFGFSSPESQELFATFEDAPPAESKQAAVDLGQYILDEAWFAVVDQPDVVVASIPEVTVDIVSIIYHLEKFRKS